MLWLTNSVKRICMSENLCRLLFDFVHEISQPVNGHSQYYLDMCYRWFVPYVIMQCDFHCDLHNDLEYYLAGRSLMAQWLERAPQGYKMFCHDPGVEGSNLRCVVLGFKPGMNQKYFLHSHRNIPRLTLTVTLSNITRCWLETCQSGYHIPFCLPRMAV